MISFLKSSKFKAGLPTVLMITGIWLLIGVAEVGFEYLNFFQHEIFPNNYNILMTLKSNLVGIGIAAFLGGNLFVYWQNNGLQNHYYGKVLWTVFIYYNIIFFFSLVIGSILYHCDLNNLSGVDGNVLSSAWAYILELKFIRAYFFWAIISLMTIIALQVNDKYGAGVFWAFLRGDYFQPKKEERIFMFLDLRGSTTIAEKIGEELYFEFIRDFFKDVTPSILASKGEIYQYVGDEVIVSWKKEKGIEKQRAINCFFDIEKNIANKGIYYQEKYGLMPSFKAGLHIGTAMIGEIGVIKKDIAFSGDVVNTTSRIQARCNEFGVNLLVSQELVDELALSEKKYHLKRLGEVQLRGRAKAVTLFTITKTILAKNIVPVIKNKRIWDVAFN